MRGCATCAELELLLEKTADDHWNLVLRASNGVEPEPERAKTLKQQVRAAKIATDEALAQYKRHLETAHSRAISPTQ
jgi:hypothetical protein